MMRSLILWMLGGSGTVLAVEARPLEIGLIEFTPLVTYDSKAPEGPLFDYAASILKQAGVTAHYVEVSIGRGLEQLRNQHLDMVLTLFRTPDREGSVRFSAEPLLAVNFGFCTFFDAQAQPLTARTRLAYVRGTVLPDGLRGLSLFPVNGEKAQTRMLQMMDKDRVDAIYSPKPEVILLAARGMPLGRKPRCYQLKNSLFPIYFGYSKAVPDAVVKRIDASLHQALQTEDFDHYLKRRLLQAGIPEPDVQTIDPASLPRP